MDFASKDKVLRLLEQAAASLDGSTGEDLGPAFKRYRQAVFKLNYKINKLNAGKRGAAKVRPFPETANSLGMHPSFFCVAAPCRGLPEVKNAASLLSMLPGTAVSVHLLPAGVNPCANSRSWPA